MSLAKLDSFLDVACFSGGVGDVYLEESDPTSKIRKVKLSGMPANSLLVPLDKARRRKCDGCPRMHNRVVSFLVETQESKAHRLTDYVLLSLRSDGLYDCYLIEIKSESPTGISSQFMGSKCVVIYLENFLRLQHSEPLEVKRWFFVLIQSPEKGGNFVKPPIGSKNNFQSSAGDPIRLFRNDNSEIKFAELDGKGV